MAKLTYQFPAVYYKTLEIADTRVRETIRTIVDSINAVLVTISKSVNGLYDIVEGNGAPHVVPTYTVGTLPSAVTYARGIIYVSDETGGATLAFSDGTDWRRVQDRAVVS